MTRNIAGLAALAALTLLAGKALHSQATAPRQWEYIEITETQKGTERGAGFSSAIICRATAKGCQEQNFTADWKEWSSPASGPIAAAAMLGEQGWEMVGATVAGDGRTHLYLRRPRE